MQIGWKGSWQIVVKRKKENTECKFQINFAWNKIHKAIKTVYNFSLNINVYYLYSKCMNHLKANSNYSLKQNSNITRQERKNKSSMEETAWIYKYMYVYIYNVKKKFWCLKWNIVIK